MATPKLIQLWENIEKHGYNIRKNNLDGLNGWNIIKKELIKNDVMGKWNKKIVGVYGHMKTKLGIKEELCEIDEEDKNIQKKIWEKHHFYLQHARIPVLNFEEPKLYRLMQIAYNAGQLRALFDDPFYTMTIKEYYINNELGKMSSYMDDKYLNQFENSINGEFIQNTDTVLDVNANANGKIGGHFYRKKYYKYKAKYLENNNK